MSAPGRIESWPRGADAPTVGIYGGTFNPIHLGHLRAAEEVAEALGLERIVFVPSARPPHKGRHAEVTGQGRDDGQCIAPAEQRLVWVREAIASNPRFEADPIEIERRGPSFLVDTLEAFGQRLAPRKPVFVLGRDAFCDIGGWREPARLLTLAHFAVTTRPPHTPGTLAEWLPEAVRDQIELAEDGRSGRHREAGTRIQLIEITALDISASDVRERVRSGRSIRYLVPERVADAIEASGVYGPNPYAEPAAETGAAARTDSEAAAPASAETKIPGTGSAGSR